MEEQQNIIIYQTEDGQTQIDVRLEQEMIWLTRQQLANLFGRDYKTISKHINNALKEELADSVVVAKFAHTTQHGAIEGKTQTHDLEYFNYGAQNEAYNVEGGRKTPKAVYLQRVAMVEAMRSAQNEMFT